MTIDTTKLKGILPCLLVDQFGHGNAYIGCKLRDAISKEEIKEVAQTVLDQQAKIEELKKEIELRKTSGYEF